MVSKVLKSLAVVSTLVCTQMAQALPLSLTSNSTYSLSGTGVGEGGYSNNGTLFLAFSQKPHSSTVQSGDFNVFFNLSGSMNTGNISGSNLSSLDVNVLGNLVSIVQFDGTKWNDVSGASGTASATFHYSNLTLNPGNDIFAAIQGTGSGSGGIHSTLSFGGNSGNINEDVKPSFMPFDHASQGFYDPAINAFSTNGILDAAFSGFNSGIHSWFESYTQVQFGGTTYFLQGDIHANYSDVPEPASMGLLTAGLLGIMGRRKKRSLA